MQIYSIPILWLYGVRLWIHGNHFYYVHTRVAERQRGDNMLEHVDVEFLLFAAFFAFSIFHFYFSGVLSFSILAGSLSKVRARKNTKQKCQPQQLCTPTMLPENSKKRPGEVIDFYIKFCQTFYAHLWHRLASAERSVQRAGGEIRIWPTQPCHVRIER